jgi:alkaline phosphatase
MQTASATIGRHRRTVTLVVGLVALSFITARADTAKNVIVMIADGAGFNTYNAASYYQYGATGTQVYEQPGWVRYGCSTYPLNLSTSPTGTGVQNPNVVYNPTQAWNGLPGYVWLKTTYTDSAAAATALATGVKTYNSAINWTDLNQPLTGRTIAEYAKQQGRSVGTISTVEWSHATPAGLGGAHNVDRDNYAAIANELLNAPYLDVIMGAGNPDYNNNGVYVPGGEAKYVGGPATWNQLKTGTHPAGWNLVQDKAAFESLATGPTPGKVVGVAQVATTLQQVRSGYGPGDVPFGDPFIPNVPTLRTMTRAALNVLDDDPQGLFLHIEGGAVDWANHSNQRARMIEEQVDFNQSVAAVVDWVDTHSSWDETLLIVTADHETGLLWGPESNTLAYQDLVNNGAGLVPGMRYNATGHSNSLVPLFARGVGSELFAGLVDGYDATALAHWGVGAYVDNADIFSVMHSVIPEPANMLLLLAASAIGTGALRRH